jgi:hypothetical protein
VTEREEERGGRASSPNSDARRQPNGVRDRGGRQVRRRSAKRRRRRRDVPSSSGGSEEVSLPRREEVLLRARGLGVRETFSSLVSFIHSAASPIELEKAAARRSSIPRMRHSMTEEGRKRETRKAG